MKFLLILGSVIALPSFAAGGGDLDASDYTGVSFWLVTAALLASTVFFFIERVRVAAKWKTSLSKTVRLLKYLKSQDLQNPKQYLSFLVS